MPIKAAMWVVLLPGAAHISNTVSPGCGFKTRTQMIEGKFCNKQDPIDKESESGAIQPDILLYTSTAMPLNNN